VHRRRSHGAYRRTGDRIGGDRVDGKTRTLELRIRTSIYRLPQAAQFNVAIVKKKGRYERTAKKRGSKAKSVGEAKRGKPKGKQVIQDLEVKNAKGVRGGRAEEFPFLVTK
jgi:hypothetical protein